MLNNKVKTTRPVSWFKLEQHLIQQILSETVNVNLAYGWFIGYNLTEAVPDPSSLSKIREGYGLEVSYTRIARHFRDQGGVSRLAR